MKLFAPTIADAYKLSHPKQIPNDVSVIYSNFTCRGAKHFPFTPIHGAVRKVTHYGTVGNLRELIELWNETFFSQPHDEVIAKYKEIIESFTDGDVVPVQAMSDLHKLGFLPIRVKALPEGSRVPLRVANYTIANTRRKFKWVTNYVETQMSSNEWPMITNATISTEFRLLLDTFADLTGVDRSFVDIQGHDFSARGMRGNEDAARSGGGHGLNFLGSDTVHYTDYVRQFYRGKESGLLAISVPATEHMVMCIRIAFNGDDDEGELKAFEELLDLYPTGIISVVSDTRNFFHFLRAALARFGDRIKARAKNAAGFAKVVFRPDSGYPVDIICGKRIPVPGLDQGNLYNVRKAGYDVAYFAGKHYYVAMDTPGHYTATLLNEVSDETLGAAEIINSYLPGGVTPKGFKVYDEHVGMIYGDSITYYVAHDMLLRAANLGFASCLSLLGMGSYTYAYATRDSLGAAIKATAAVREVPGQDGVLYNLFKDPVTDRDANGKSVKKSAKGLLRIEREGNTYVQYEEQTWDQEAQGALQEVLADGVFTEFGSPKYSDMRLRLKEELAECEERAEMATIISGSMFYKAPPAEPEAVVEIAPATV